MAGQVKRGNYYSNLLREGFKKKKKKCDKCHTLGGGGLKSGVRHTKKKKMLPKCVLGHLESFKTHLFLGEKWGVPLFLGIFG